MMKHVSRMVALMLIAALTLPAGCGWVGRTAGKTKAAIEDSADNLERGYNEGYRGEKKSKPSGTASKPAEQAPAEGAEHEQPK